MTTVNNIPSIQSPIVDLKTGYGTAPWIQFFAGLTSPAQPTESVLVATSSPFTYTASKNGVLFVSGGLVNSISIQRSIIVIPTGVTQGPIPLSQGDKAIITYRTAPTLNFLPAAGIGSTRR